MITPVFKGTPGPWHYQVKADVYTHIVRDPSGNRIVMYAPQSTAPETKANAMLCAAAPELLEALRETILALSGAVSIIYNGAERTEEFGEKVGEARRKFHAAIAKALGEQS